MSYKTFLTPAICQDVMGISIHHISGKREEPLDLEKQSNDQIAIDMYRLSRKI